MARNREFNEQEAIKRAMDVFWKKGYNGASMRDLTDAMQINSSSLYNSIGDKHKLFVKCIQNYTEERMKEAKARASQAKTPLKAIVNFIQDSVNTILYSNNSCLAIKTTFEVAANDSAIQAILKSDADKTHSLLAELIIKAREQKEIDSEEDPETIADFIMNAFTGWYESYILYQNPVKIKKMAKYLITRISQ
ncbi:MAG TPA: TetR/AcrR family transcriptional regulator [Porphyromonadaceae bacterium]|jgi:TetR/AcrR family transcriptional repressor of nem operon|nr:TetR/AcrR family transcriptional regulator [Porphyromonadaceae bacterium]HBX21202.1 TetR/AcrR family transcriptional regulator [Porphyromonadaceae bacterium]